MSIAPAPAPLVIQTNADLSAVSMYQQIALFYPDVNLYSVARNGKTLTVVQKDGVKRTGTLQQKVFGPLVTVLTQFGQQYPSMYGKVYDVSSVIDEFVEQFDDSTLPADGRTLYVVLVITLDPLPTPVPTNINVIPLTQNTGTVNAIAA